MNSSVFYGMSAKVLVERCSIVISVLIINTYNTVDGRNPELM